MQDAEPSGVVENNPASDTLKVVWEYVWTLGLMALVVFSARSSLADWYEVPSGSMLPTIQLGDRIFVNKLAYDLRVPFAGSYIPLLDKTLPYMSLARIGSPSRGDIVVFVYPEDNRTDYVKRLVGLPGDRVELRRDHLYVNGEHMERRPAEQTALPPGAARERAHQLYVEQLGTVNHFVFENLGSGAEDFPLLTVPASGQAIHLTYENFDLYRRAIQVFEGRSDIDLRSGGVYEGDRAITEYTFKNNYYFMMGDNRDNSSDSRVWGFVPEQNLRGRALRVVLSFDPSFFMLDPRRIRWARALLPINELP